MKPLYALSIAIPFGNPVEATLDSDRAIKMRDQVYVESSTVVMESEPEMQWASSAQATDFIASLRSMVREQIDDVLSGAGDDFESRMDALSQYIERNNNEMREWLKKQTEDSDA